MLCLQTPKRGSEFARRILSLGLSFGMSLGTFEHHAYASADSEVTQAQTSPPVPSLCHSIHTFVDRTLEQHPSLQVKKSAIAASQSELQIAKYQYFPNLSVTSERSKGVSPQSGDRLNGTINLRLQQTLWSGGRLGAGLDLSKNKIDLANANLNETQFDLSFKVIDAWTAWLLALGRSQATEKSLIQLEQLHAMIVRRVEQQVSAPVDAQLMSLRLNLAKNEWVVHRSNLVVAQKRLLQYSGQVPDARLAQQSLLNCTFKKENNKTIELSEFAASKVQQHPSFQRVEKEIALVQAEIAQKKTELWPSLYARFERQFTDSGYFFGSGIENRVYLGFQFSTGSGLSLNESIKQVQSKKAGFEAEQESMRREILQRIETDGLESQMNLEKIQFLSASLQTHENLLQSYTRLFTTGRRSWLEVLNAARELAQAEISLSDAYATELGIQARLHLYEHGVSAKK